MRTRQHRRGSLLLLLLLASVTAGCSSSTTTTDEPQLPPIEEVEPPFPSDIFTVDDDRAATGLRVALDAVDSPLLDPILDIGIWARDDLIAWLGNLDGFSTFGPIYWTASEALDPATVVGDGPTASVLLIDLSRPTERLPIDVGYADVRDEGGEPLHVVHLTPTLPLLAGQQHAVVVLRQHLRNADGSDPGQSGFFQVLIGDRDIAPQSSWREPMQRVSERAAPLRDYLEGAGISTEDVAHAFTFTTQSARDVLLAARDYLHGDSAPPLHLDWDASFAAEDLPDAPENLPDQSSVARVLKGRFDAPDLRGADHDVSLPLASAEIRTVPFILAVPKEPRGGGNQPFPIVVLQHGHGGNKERALYVAPYLAAHGIATAAIDHVNHGELANEGPFIDVVNPARLRGNFVQTAVNGLRLVQALRSLDEVTVDGATVRLDSSAGVGYIGESLGAITGVPLTGVEPQVGVAVFNVGGGGLASSLGGRFLALLDEANLPLKLGAIAVLQTFLDRVDPVTFASLLQREGGKNATPALMQHVVSDDMGPETVEVLARALGATYVCPCPDEIPLEGLPREEAPARSPGVFYYAEGNHGFLLADDEFPEASEAVRTQAASFFADYFAGREPMIIDPLAR